MQTNINIGHHHVDSLPGKLAHASPRRHHDVDVKIHGGANPSSQPVWQELDFENQEQPIKRPFSHDLYALAMEYL